MKRALAMIILLTSVNMTSLFAQAASTPLDAAAAAAAEAKRPVTMELTEAVMPVDLSLRSSVTSGKDTAAVIAASQDDKSARIRVENAAGATSTWHFTLSGPIDKNNDRTSLLGLHGLEGTASIEGGMLWRLSTETVTLGTKGDLEERIHQLCRRANLPEQQLGNGVTVSCDVLSQSVTSDPRLAPELAKLITTHGLTRFLSAQVQYSHDNFQFRDASTLTKEKASHPAYTAEAAFTFLPLFRNTIYSVSLKGQYESGFMAGSSVQLCLPAPGGASECGSAVIGAPTRNRVRAGAIESRLYLAGGTAIEPIARYDWENKSYSAELPIYFVRNGDGKLAGGLTVGWDSKAHTASAAVFVGSILKALSSP